MPSLPSKARRKPSLAILRGLIIDMDGVLWAGDSSLPGMQEFLAFLRAQGITFQLATNNSSLTPRSYVEKLARLGAAVSETEVLTSAMATAEYLRQHAAPGEKVYVVGEEGVCRAVEDAGLRVADPEDLDAGFVVCGMDRGISWRKLANATINLRKGARLIGTNGDSTFPTERGIAHGNGAILAALTKASGVRPIIIGKPNTPLYRMAIQRLNLPRAQVAALGDRLETDILGASRARINSILVLSGVTDRAIAASSSIKPTWIFSDLPALHLEWRRQLAR